MTVHEHGAPLGLTGATAATRYVGGTASGAPASGTFAVGDFVIDQTAAIWVCTVAGTPGTWVSLTGTYAPLAGATFAGAVAVPDDAYAAGWDGSANVPTKNAVYDKIQSLSGGAMAFIAQTVLGSATATIDFTSIPATYETLMIDVLARGDNATAQYLRARFNNDSSAIYDSQEFYGTNATVVAGQALTATAMNVGLVPGTNATAAAAFANRITIPSYARTTLRKIARSEVGGALGADGAAGSWTAGAYAAGWRSTAAVNSVTLFPSAGSFVAGTVATLYGVKGS